MQSIKETAGRWGYKIPCRYDGMMQWLENIKELDYSRDRENMLLLYGLEKELERAEKDWLSENQNSLLFLIESMDIGFASVDALTIMEKGTEKVIGRKHFLGTGEAQHFVSNVISQEEMDLQCISA